MAGWAGLYWSGCCSGDEVRRRELGGGVRGNGGSLLADYRAFFSSAKEISGCMIPSDVFGSRGEFPIVAASLFTSASRGGLGGLLGGGDGGRGGMRLL